ENRRRLTIHHRRKDGSTYPVELHLQYSTLGEQPLFVAFAQDITSRWQMEQQLIRRNRELDLLNRIMLASFSNPSPNTILQIACRELTRTFDLPYVNAAIIDETGQRAEFLEEYGSQTDVVLQGRSLALEEDDNIRYLLSQSAPLRLDNAARHPRLARYHHLLAENRITTLYVFPLIAEGQNFGSLNLCLTKDSRFEDADVDLVWRMAGQVAAVIARTRLVEQHRRLGVAIEQAAESVVMTDLAGSIIYVNPAFERITGYSREEAIGQNPRILKSGKHDAAFYRHLWNTITAGKVWHGRFVNKKKTGELYTEEATITPVRSEAGEIVGYVAVKRDITHELQLEEQFHQAQKMEALGRLTGGVAHDFNNLLTAINGFAELMKLRVKPDDPLYPMLNNILKSGEKATRLVQHLLTFSRKQVTNPRVVDLNAVVQDMEKLLRRIIGEDIHLTVRLSPDVYPVYIDPTQMEQVLMNLVVNARDAMPKGGKLTIETATADLDEAYTADHLEARPGKHTVLAVSDSGSGIPDDVLPHIFEPFFTTKSGGTGLGLATVYGIVRQNGGHITVYSETGIGTTFKIYLPYAAIPQPEVSTPTARETMIPTGKETILLVEDNNDVRILAEQALQSLGYTLLVAQNGEEAVQLAAAYPGHIDLLLTDVVMPGLSGPELAEQLQASRPGLKVIFMSGYTEATVARHGILDDRVPYVQKPFSPTVIAYKIREVLDAPA
ncbi:MAG: PAS domain S-box protein, partial [Chloroflexi bacterium]